MYITIQDIIRVTHGVCDQQVDNQYITDITYDSRNLLEGKKTLFIPLTTGRRDGHTYVNAAVKSGVTCCLISDDSITLPESSCVFIKVDDTLVAYQSIAAWRRSQVSFPIIGITGSNGKTIVKEWLSTILEPHYSLIKTPKSYNSQIGVTQSLVPIDEKYTLGLFEVGISQIGEMKKLKKMLKPTIGIFTNIGDAHQENFNSLQEKINEKLLLFKNVESLVYCRDHEEIHKAIILSDLPRNSVVSWGKHPESTIKIDYQVETKSIVHLKFTYHGQTEHLTLSGITPIELENLMHVISLAVLLDIPAQSIQAQIEGLDQLPMRLQVLQGYNGNVIINDSYTTDLHAFRYALDYLHGLYPDLNKVVVTSEPDNLELLTNLLNDYQVSDLIRVKSGQEVSSVINEIKNLGLTNTAILVKGKRHYRLEKISDALSHQTRTTTLEVHLPSISHNLKRYSQHLDAQTRIFAVIKASAYGSGGTQIGRYLSRLPIDTLAVAVLDEGRELREQGITLPIMLFNFSDYHAVDSLWEYDLEPEIYSIDQLSLLSRASKFQDKPLNIHLKIETGMHRLGLELSQLEGISSLLNESPLLRVRSIFSHLVSSEVVEHDQYTDQQYQRYLEFYQALCKKLNYKPIRHILNTAGILRHPKYQMDAVRIGLGLYGIDETGLIENEIQQVLTLKAQVLQIKEVKAGGSVSYGRSWVAQEDQRIAVIGIGYADGLPRAIYKGGGAVYYKGRLLPYVGNICMDVCMVDVSCNIEIEAGDTVEIFGQHQSLATIADQVGTISYEVLCQISPRVKRIYIED